MPVFNKQFYSDTVPENIELHSPLSVAIQAESPLGRKLIYTIVKGNELEEFAVDFNTGKSFVFLYFHSFTRGFYPCSFFFLYLFPVKPCLFLQFPFLSSFTLFEGTKHFLLIYIYMVLVNIVIGWCSVRLCMLKRRL